jgi:hypothetical protein
LLEPIRIQWHQHIQSWVKLLVWRRFAVCPVLGALEGNRGPESPAAAAERHTNR